MAVPIYLAALGLGAIHLAALWMDLYILCHYVTFESIHFAALGLDLYFWGR